MPEQRDDVIQIAANAAAWDEIEEFIRSRGWDLVEIPVNAELPTFGIAFEWWRA